MDWLQVLANIAQIIGVIWVLSFGGKAFTDVIRDIRIGSPIKVNPLVTLNILVSAILVVLLGMLVHPILISLPGPFSSHITSTPTAASSFSTPNGIPSLPLPVQSAFMASTNDTNTVSFTQKVRPGDLILVAVTQYERQVTDLRDNQGDAWKKVGGIFANPVNQQDFIELYFFPNVKGGKKTAVTVSFGSFADPDGGDTNVGIYEYTGLMVKDEETATSNGQKATSIALNRMLLTSNHGLCFAVGVDSGPDNNGAYDQTVKMGDQYTLLYPSTTEELALDDANTHERFYTEAASVSTSGCLPNFSIAPSYTAYLAIVAVSLAPSG